VVAVASTVAVMVEQVALEAVAVVEHKMLILLVLEALVDYLMVQMVLKHLLLILETTKVEMEQVAPEVVVVAVAPMEMLILTLEVEMVVPVLSSLLIQPDK